MARYVALLSWTDQGVEAFKDTVDRASSAAGLAQQLGGSMDAVYWTLGPYDLVALMQFDDDETATAFSLAVGARGNVRTTTMRAFDDGEMQEIMAKVS